MTALQAISGLFDFLHKGMVCSFTCTSQKSYLKPEHLLLL